MNYLTAKRSLFFPASWFVVGVLFCLFSTKMIGGHEQSIYSLIAGVLLFFSGVVVCFVVLRYMPVWVKITIDKNKTPLFFEEVTLFGKNPVKPIDTAECEIKSATIGGKIIFPYARFKIIHLK